jgi:hypothetical protein
MYLQRYHDMQISHSGVWRVLKRLDMKPVYQLPLVVHSITFCVG